MSSHGPATWSRARFFFSVMLPVLSSVVITFGFVFGLIYLSGSRTDEEAVVRQTTLVEHIVSEQSNLLRQQQADVVGWDDAVQATRGELDLEWLTANLGTDLYESSGHDLTFLLDPLQTPVFAVMLGEEVSTDTYQSVEETFSPFVTRLRELDWQGALAAYMSGRSHVLPAVGDVMMVVGKPALVSFMPIASDSGRFDYLPGSEYIHISVQFLDQALADELAGLLLINGARFTGLGALEPQEAGVEIRDRNGKTVARFVWMPDRPGARVMADGMPGMIAALVIVSLIIGALLFGLRRSTSQIEKERAAAQHRAFHDKLTGLANRALFEDRLIQAVAHARRGPTGVALLMIDLDRFKQVNDTLGHEAGDQLIQQVADRLRPLLRETDTIARLGGDEFAVIQTDVKSMADVGLVAQRIIKSIGEPFNVAASQAFVGSSIGIAIAPQDAVNATELARKADIALYEAKAGGRNQFKVFEDRMSEAVRRRQTIEEELRDALNEDNGLDVEYHPVARSDGTQLVGVAANIVWKHPELGEVPQDRFIPVAESCGLIELLGEFVLRLACGFGSARPGLRVSVRVYPAQLRNPLFFDKLFTILEETGMQPEDLELEISESMLSDSEPVAQRTLRKLSGAGINIALGDFGNGFRALSLLQKFQVDRIKIDRHFIAQLADCPDPEAITHAVVWLARAIGVEVSAEGVDTVDQKNFLNRMGVMSFQGEVFSPENQAELLRGATISAPQNEPRKAPQEDIELWG